MSAVSEPLPWQQPQWQQVTAQLAGQQLPHALLLVGPRYTGKVDFAQALARLLLCQAPESGRNCGHCHSCELSAAGNHGDFCRLEPEEKSRVIKIDQVRAALDFTTRTAGFGRRKVVLINPAEGLNANAANALLKCLEEPATNTHMLLVCHRLQGLPATVRSRCQQLGFPLPGAAQSLAWLAQFVVDDAAAAADSLAAAEDRPLLALHLYREGETGKLVALGAALKALREGRLSAPEMAEMMAGLDLQDNLALLKSHVQQWLRNCPRADIRNNRGRSGFLLLDELQQLQGAISRGSNPNPALLLDTLLSRLQRELGQAS
jgi:DNA polymerase-3 subunit delta'